MLREHVCVLSCTSLNWYSIHKKTAHTHKQQQMAMANEMIVHGFEYTNRNENKPRNAAWIEPHGFNSLLLLAIYIVKTEQQRKKTTTKETTPYTISKCIFKINNNFIFATVAKPNNVSKCVNNSALCMYTTHKM